MSWEGCTSNRETPSRKRNMRYMVGTILSNYCERRIVMADYSSIAQTLTESLKLRVPLWPFASATSHLRGFQVHRNPLRPAACFGNGERKAHWLRGRKIMATAP